MQLYSWDALKKEAINDKLARRFVSGQRMTMAQFFFAESGTVPRHHHESEQLTYVVEGALRFIVGDQEVTVHRGEVLHIPSDVPHGAVALEGTVVLEIFSPARSDWLAAG
jgi:quercetin dioxygenase-like cupin family protein